MKRVLVLAVAAALGVSASGCCWWWPYWGYGYGGYNCPSGACGTVPPGTTVTPPQTGAVYGTWDTIQTGFPPAAPTVAPPPTAVAPYPTTTALAPLESLPTY